MATELLIIEVIKNVGFPIALVMWFMFRTEKIIKNNTVALTEIKAFLEHLKGN